MKRVPKYGKCNIKNATKLQKEQWQIDYYNNANKVQEIIMKTNTVIKQWMGSGQNGWAMAKTTEEISITSNNHKTYIEFGTWNKNKIIEIIKIITNKN